MSELVLVTGAAGYVGSVLCEHLLHAGFSVRALDKITFEPSLFHLCANPRFDFILGDVRDEALMVQAMTGVDVIIPLAAIVGAPASKRDPWMTTEINRDAIRLITKLRSPSQLIIYPTTNSGYGTQTGDLFCTEETPLEPISLYGTTKAEAEADVLASGNSITLRLATVFGMSPRMRLDLLVNHFTYAAVTDGYMVIFEKHFKRNYVHVRDVADCFIHCIRNQQKMIGRPYNVGLDSANLSKEELAEKIKQKVPKFFIHYSEIGSDPDKRNYIVSNQRLREAGFEASRAIDDGIVELLKGYRMLGRGRFQNV
jgi:nucleoside-diphosphate-sugar epimerase